MADLDDPKRLDRIGLHLTDTSHDAVLDALIREAARRTDAPIALASLVLGRIQLFRSSVGLPPDLELSRATSRCGAFCQVVVRDEAELIITDAATDPRIPPLLVEKYGIRAYVGVPLRHGGRVIGSLCALDTKPRSWDASAARELEAIAAQVAERLNDLEEQKDREEAEAMGTHALRLALESVLHDARAVEERAARLRELLKDQAWAALPFAEDSVEDPAAVVAGEVAALYRKLDEPIQMIRRRALRVADAIELRGVRKPGMDEDLAALRLHARALHRSLRELGPLARLIEALGKKEVSAEAFARNASALAEATQAADDMLASLGELTRAATRLTPSLPGRA